jgi:hypothetical protein
LRSVSFRQLERLSRDVMGLQPAWRLLRFVRTEQHSRVSSSAFFKLSFERPTRQERAAARQSSHVPALIGLHVLWTSERVRSCSWVRLASAP